MSDSSRKTWSIQVGPEEESHVSSANGFHSSVEFPATGAVPAASLRLPLISAKPSATSLNPK
jgi:hypothetical protein